MKKGTGQPLREGRLKVLNVETSTWTPVWAMLTFAEDGVTVLLIVKEDEKGDPIGAIVVDKTCRFIADASKTTGTVNTFSAGGPQAAGKDLNFVFRADPDDYKKWTTDLGRAKMTSSGYSASVRGLSGLFKTQRGPSQGSISTPSKAQAGSKEFNTKLVELFRLEEQVARKRMEAMNVLALMEQAASVEEGGPTAIPSARSKVPSRIESCKQSLQQEFQKRLVVTEEWAGGSGDLQLAAGEVLQCWYLAPGGVWGFGCIVQPKDGREVSGWFPLALTKPYEPATPRQHRSTTLGNMLAATTSPNSSGVAEVKKLDLEGFAVKVFNMKAKKGVQWIKEQLYKGITDLSEVDVIIGHFLWEHRKELNKEQLGELFGEDSEEAQRIYRSFVSRFILVGLDLDLALRRLLYLFKLPGEAQKIDRILKVFSEHYYASNCGPDTTMPLVRDAIKSPAEAYTLVFALMMLNTDAHSETVLKRMTCPEFLENIRYSTKDGIFIDQDYLTDMYWRIVNEEIKMQEDARYPFANKKGYLDMKIGPFWAKRWLILSDGHLLVCKTSTHEDEVLLNVPVASTIVEDVTSDSGVVLFTIATPITKLRLRAKSDRERSQWLTALEKERDVVVVEEESVGLAVVPTMVVSQAEESPIQSLSIPPTPITPVSLSSSDFSPKALRRSSEPEDTESGRSSVSTPVSSRGGSGKTPRGSHKTPRGTSSGSLTARGHRKKMGTAGKRRKKRRKVVALYDIQAPAGSQRISVGAGEVLLLISRTNEKWYKVQNHAGVSGYIPASYVTRHVSGISSIEPPPQPEMPAEDFTRRSSTDAPSEAPASSTVADDTPAVLYSPGFEDDEGEDDS